MIALVLCSFLEEPFCIPGAVFGTVVFSVLLLPWHDLFFLFHFFPFGSVHNGCISVILFAQRLDSIGIFTRLIYFLYRKTRYYAS
jgi:hypothetical protein